MSYDSNQDAIVAAYLDLAQKPQDWVRLASLRPLLSLDRDVQDLTLLAMVRTGSVHLSPDSNRKVLTDADHTAALTIGGDANHLVAIEDDFFQD